MDVGSAGRLAQHDLHITEQVSNHAIPRYLFHPSIPDQARHTSSRPDTILVTPCPANPTIPPASPSHPVLCSMSCNEDKMKACSMSCNEDKMKSKKQHNSSQATS
eukprot:883381-Pelagomonas_calceolata.AAC.1